MATDVVCLLRNLFLNFKKILVNEGCFFGFRPLRLGTFLGVYLCSSITNVWWGCCVRFIACTRTLFEALFIFLSQWCRFHVGLPTAEHLDK